MTATHKTGYCRCGAPLARDNRGLRCAACAAADRNRLVTVPDVAPEFWNEPVLHKALLSRHMGKVVRAWRTHPDHGRNPIPQDQMAAWLGITQAQLSRIENGPPMVHLDRLIHWARVLHIPTELLWFAMPNTTWPPGDDDVESPATGVPRDSDFSSNQGGAVAVLRPGSLSSSSAVCAIAGSAEYGRGDPVGSEVGDLTDRRQAMQTLGGAAISVGLAGLFAKSATDAMEFTRRTEVSDIGPRTLEHLELAVAGMAHAFAHTPPADMFRLAQSYRQQVASFIDGRQTMRQRRELYRHAGWLSIILGWLSHDLGDSLAAETHCVDAWEHGWQAEDGEICGWAMDTTATIAMYNNQPERARDAALKGLSQAPAGGPAAVRLACQHTRACGRLGHADQFDDVLINTRQQLDHLPQQGSGLFSVDTGRIASYAATSSIWLSRPDDAVRYAREALDFYARVDPTERSPTREAISRIDLGLALIALKIPDGAAEEVLQALNSERITGTVLARAGEVDAALQLSYPALASTRNVHERYLALTYQQGSWPQFTT